MDKKCVIVCKLKPALHQALPRAMLFISDNEAQQNIYNSEGL